jgi:hypothetical protein
MGVGTAAAPPVKAKVDVLRNDTSAPCVKKRMNV